MYYNLYDFDKTIYDGDCTIDFYFYCLRKKIKIIRFLPILFIYIILFKFKKVSKEVLKEHFFLFLNDFSNISDIVNKFWNKNKFKIKEWYLAKSHKQDIIISASPEFLLKPIANKLKVFDLIATKVNPKTGKLLSNNCYGKEKVHMLNKKYSNIKIFECYTDSLTDKPLLELAENGYIVKKNKIAKYRKEDHLCC